ncbi:MAG: SseB family protein [Micrococcaceae bacterium]
MSNRYQQQLPERLKNIIIKYDETDYLARLTKRGKANEFNNKLQPGNVEYLGARTQFRAGAIAEVELYKALSKSDFLIAVKDKATSSQVVLVKAPDGRKTLPIFTSRSTFEKWNPNNKAISLRAKNIARLAVIEGVEILVVDPGQHEMQLVRRPAIWSLARQVKWQPAYDNPEVAELFANSVSGITTIRKVELAPAATVADLRAGKVGVVELRVTLAIRPGLGQEEIQSIVNYVQQVWATDKRLIQLVDSLELKVISASF